MATDGQRIIYNPEFVEALTPAELEGVLAHEVLHCALAHHCRRGNREPAIWNEACDYAVNPIVLDNGMVLPAGVLVDCVFSDLSAEEIYSRLKKEREQQPPRMDSKQGGGTGGNGPVAWPQGNPAGNAAAERACAAELGTRPGGFGEVLDARTEDGKPVGQADNSRQEQEWSIAAAQAIRSAEGCGRRPGGVERLLAEVRESRQDWRSILRDFLAAVDPSDYGWTPPNRRFIASGLYLPSVIRSGIGEIVIVVDTSGSIDADELQEFAGEITAIASEARPERIHVLYADAAVQGAELFMAGDEVVLQPVGGGGTDFRPAFEWIEDQGLDPRCVLYLTDLCCRSFPEEPPYPVLWVTGSRRTGPFGETLRIESES